jgi:hypothetical protein
MRVKDEAVLNISLNVVFPSLRLATAAQPNPFYCMPTGIRGPGPVLLDLEVKHRL